MWCGATVHVAQGRKAGRHRAPSRLSVSVTDTLTTVRSLILILGLSLCVQYLLNFTLLPDQVFYVLISLRGSVLLLLMLLRGAGAGSWVLVLCALCCALCCDAFGNIIS